MSNKIHSGAYIAVSKQKYIFGDIEILKTTMKCVYIAVRRQKYIFEGIKTLKKTFRVSMFLYKDTTLFYFKH